MSTPEPTPQVVYVSVTPRRTNGLAVASLVLGIVWVWWIGSTLAVIFGTAALYQISESGDQQAGRGMAIAGLVLGLVGLAVLGVAALGAVATG